MISEFPNEILSVILVLSINLFITLFYLVIINNEKMKTDFNNMNIILQKLFVFLFIGPLFISPFLPQPRFTYFHWSITLVGVVITLVGALMILCSFFKIGMIPSIKVKSGLSTSGTYGIVRHPIYSGTIIAFLGLIVMMRAVLSLAYLPFSVLLYYLMTVHEERDLIKMYGEDYLSYRKAVRRRIIPFAL